MSTVESGQAIVLTSFGGSASLRLQDLPTTAPRTGEVVIDVVAAGVNYPDLLMVDGTYQKLPPLPFVPGKEAAGIVRSVGPSVDELAVGDRVLALVEDGAWRAHLTVPADRVVPVPADMTFAEASSFALAYATAYFGLTRRAHVEAGEFVVVTGASGGVGAAAVAVAKLMGATVIATTRRPERAPAVRAVGADHVIVSEAADLKARVLELTNDRGADVVFDVVGGDTLRELIRATAWEGRVIIVGFASGEQPTIKPGHLLVKNIGVAGLQVSDYADRDPARMQTALRWLLQQYSDGKLRLPDYESLPLDMAAEALDRLRRGASTAKTVLTVDAMEEYRTASRRPAAH